jgi:hypothetical protein
MIDTSENGLLETDLLIDNEETNYSVLRAEQKRQLGNSIRQEHVTNLAQQNQAVDNKVVVKT